MNNADNRAQASPKKPVTRRQLLIGSSFLVGLAATSATMVHAQSDPEQDERKKSKKRIHGPGFHHIALFAVDVDATIRFYTDGLGCQRRYGWTEATTTLPTGEVFTVTRRVELVDFGDHNYVEVIAGGKPANERTGYDTFNHLALRTPDADATYARAIDAGAQPFNYMFGNQVWDGRPSDFILNGENGEGSLTVRLAYLQGINNEVIELVQNDVL